MKNFKTWMEDMPSKVLILMRGISGSGKSTLAQQLKGNGVVFSTDDYFMQDGEYKFDRGMLGINHQKNKERAEEAMQAGISPVVIDNTHIQAFEAKSYVQMAQKYGYTVEVHEPNTPWKFDAEELAKRNSHGVSLDRIQQMLGSWEKNYSVDNILASKAPWET